jgi:hypothetical protein
LQANERTKAAELDAKRQTAAIQAQSDERDREQTAMIEEMKAQLKVYEIDTKDARERDAHAAKIQQQGRDAALNAFTTMNKPQPEKRP